MSDQPELGSNEIELDNPDELIWRNVHPTWIDNGQLSSLAFKPSPKDTGKLSGAREEKVTADKHYFEFTEELGLESAGVWAVTVGEAREQAVPCVYDAESSTKPDPCPTGHTYLDFRSHSGGRVRKIASSLRKAAEERGKRHP
ncbi:hypothetical protein [Nocardia huaxiensis]|uniref:hypothetical protein n=1 Tax=Nocardia huaxiensis TaxID=2755382 RepID=UPI001E379DA7|nr:hypothetical protein [Nocardia huaxiensis]UFS93750.1 hypothetical protein LPY97_23470 [Nocardia huaxiensis]